MIVHYFRLITSLIVLYTSVDKNYTQNKKKTIFYLKILRLFPLVFNYLLFVIHLVVNKYLCVIDKNIYVNY